MTNTTQNTMTLYRYMSKEEFEKFLSGEVIKGRPQNARATCKGQNVVCFIGETTEFRSYNSGENHAYTPGQCEEFLGGIVSEDVLVEFQVPAEEVKAGRGTYADPYGSGFSTIYIDEFYMDEYSNKTVKCTRYAYKEDRRWDNGEIRVEWKENKSKSIFSRVTKAVKAVALGAALVGAALFASNVETTVTEPVAEFAGQEIVTVSTDFDKDVRENQFGAIIGSEQVDGNTHVYFVNADTHVLHTLIVKTDGVYSKTMDSNDVLKLVQFLSIK